MKNHNTLSSNLANEKSAELLNPPVILVAEDDDISRLLMETLLYRLGLSVISVNNGAKAIDMFKIHPEIIAVLMDIKMPVLDGIGAIKEIKMISSTIPVIAVTAFSLWGEGDFLKEAGFDDCITKPFEVEVLTEKLSKFGIQVSH